MVKTFKILVTELYNTDKKRLLEEMYTAHLLGSGDRRKLLKRFPPKYPDVIAHHVTVKFGVSKSTPIPEPAKIEVVGYADDGESIEALVVSVNGKTEKSDGSTYHITWSLDRSKGKKPGHSNDLLKRYGWEDIDPPIPIVTTPSLEE